MMAGWSIAAACWLAFADVTPMVFEPDDAIWILLRLL
jgi:hypothetical protein